MHHYLKRLVCASAAIALVASLCAAPSAPDALPSILKNIAENSSEASKLPEPGSRSKSAVKVAPEASKEKDLIEEGISTRLADLGVEANYISAPAVEKEITAKEGKWSIGTVRAPQKNSQRKTPGNLTPGAMFAKDVDFSTGLYSGTTLLIEESTPSSFVVKGIYGLSTSITVNVDSQTGTVSIPAQGIFKGSKYGDLYICPINGSNYDPKGNIVGSFDEKGNVDFGAWGIFPISGQYAGYAVAVYRSSRWLVSNSVVKTTGPREQDITSLRGAIEQENANTLNIYGLLGYNNVIVATMTPSKTLKITPQRVYTSQAGAVMTYPVEEVIVDGEKKLMINYSGNVTGSAADNGLSLNPWTAAVSGVGSAFMLETTSIEFADALTWPAPVSASWTGNGTEQNPYLITTATELLKLSEEVEAGNSYDGYHFALGNDLDMRQLDRTYSAIGSAATPFNGVFDGRNHSIRNLRYDAIGLPAAGLFGYIGQAGAVKNLEIYNSTITGAGANVGGLAGVLAGTAENVGVRNSSITTTGEATGGLVAQLDGTLKKCDFSGSVSGKGLVGGLAAFNAGAVENSFARASVTLTGAYSSTYHTAGGLCATVASTVRGNGKGRISDSFFSGEVRDAAGNNNAGGLFGIASRATVERSFNVGTVEGAVTSAEEVYSYVGGLGAYVTDSSIADCYNSGTVIGRLAVNNELGFKAVGGLVGYLSVSSVSSTAGHYWGNLSKIENCYNSGMVLTSNENPKQGIYGRTWDGNETEIEGLTFKNIYNDSQICHEDTTAYGRRSEYLLSAILPAGFSSNVWESRSGYYPVLLSTKGYDASRLSAASITLSSDQWIGKVKNMARLRNESPVSWKLVDAAGNYADASANATIENGVLKVGEGYSNEILAATLEDGGAKLFRLALVPSGMYSGDGSKNNPYILKTPADWDNLHHAVADFGQTHEDDYFVMEGDIDFAGSSFRGVGASSISTPVNSFDGHIDGKGHTVHNFTVKAANVSAAGVLQGSGNVWHGALFPIVGKKGYIANINMAADASITVYHYGAPFVGQLLGTIENCRNYADVKCYGAYAGGIVGVVRDMGTVVGCYNAGNIYTSSNTGQGAAGIAGYNIGTIAYSQNDGDILLDAKGKNSAGGIASYSSGRIDHCVNSGNVTGPANVGGIVGTHTVMNGAGHFTYNINTGLVALSKDGVSVGGLIGLEDSHRSATGNYFDASVNVEGAVNSSGAPGLNGVATATLVAGKAPEGFTADRYDFTEGMYPSLKQFSDEPKSKLVRSVFMKFDDSQVRNNMKKNVELSDASAVAWALEPLDSSKPEELNPNFSISGNTLSVTIPSGMSLGQAVLVAKKDNATLKTYSLKALPVYLEGEGTEETPYLIKDIADFTKLADFVNTTGNDYKGVNFKLLNDLDFNGDTLVMIAGAPKSRDKDFKFQGKFDGNNKTIKNFVYEYKGGSAVFQGNDKLGIFGRIGEAGVVKDLTSQGSISGHRFVGGIAGELYGRLENCVNRSTLRSIYSAGVGGLAGTAYAGAQIDGCKNFGEVRGNSTYGIGGIVGDMEAGTSMVGCINEGTVIAEASANNAGGIVGRAGGYILNCINRGQLISEAQFSTTPKTFFGGIVGQPTTRECVVRGCINESNIDLPNQTSVGGIVGGSILSRTETATLLIDSCVNKGNVQALGTVGGLIGFAPAGAVITDSHNEGKVSTVYTAATYKSVGSSSKGTASGHAGGFAGYINSGTGAYNSSKVARCYNIGEVTSGMHVTGGFAGYVAGGAVVDSCYNEGNVINLGLNPALNGSYSSYKLGGIAGDCSGKIIHCWNSGSLVGDGHDAGGIVGLTGINAVIESCVNLGKVEVRKSAANESWTASAFQPQGAGIVGRVNGAKVNNVINLGEVESFDRAAGIASMLFAKEQTFVTNSYTYAPIRNTNASAFYISNIANYRDATDLSGQVTNLYYVKGQNSHIGANKVDDYSGVKTVESQSDLLKADLGEGFLYPSAGMPMVAGLWNGARPHLAVAATSFAGANDSEASVTDYVNLTVLPDLVWTSSSQFSISGSIAVPVELGKGWIKVSTADGNHEKTFEFNVTKTKPAVVLPTRITLDRNYAECGIGEEITLVATLSPDNVTEAESIINWTSSSDAIATVKDGKVKSLAPGTVTITATTVNNLTATCMINVMHVLPVNVNLNEHKHDGVVGEVFKLTAEVAPDNCTDKTLVWSSDAPAICTVDQEGNVSVLATGTAFITVTTVNGLTDTCQVDATAGVGKVYYDGKEVKTIYYYSLDGLRVAQPIAGEVYLKKYIFTDGSTKTEKEVFRMR